VPKTVTFVDARLWRACGVEFRALEALVSYNIRPLNLVDNNTPDDAIDREPLWDTTSEDICGVPNYARVVGSMMASSEFTRMEVGNATKVDGAQIAAFMQCKNAGADDALRVVEFGPGEFGAPVVASATAIGDIEVSCVGGKRLIFTHRREAPATLGHVARYVCARLARARAAAGHAVAAG
jgi:hypothetical protein